ncbi:hypothetical protein DT23_05345 [Thioclava indica]|uniref:Uncharacterized protein n=1 Tax=Thioclava indica TaxID=1353528 RepID=A0A074JNI1_9RHOB|nr:hypothetical protein DT23_05345 [Thioclava indica]
MIYGLMPGWQRGAMRHGWLAIRSTLEQLFAVCWGRNWCATLIFQTSETCGQRKRQVLRWPTEAKTRSVPR